MFEPLASGAGGVERGSEVAALRLLSRRYATLSRAVGTELTVHHRLLSLKLVS